MDRTRITLLMNHAQYYDDVFFPSLILSPDMFSTKDSQQLFQMNVLRSNDSGHYLYLCASEVNKDTDKKLT